MKTHTINKNGMQQIVDQLKARCKPSVFDGWLDDDLIDSRESKAMLAAWASDLETVLDDENGDNIEISAHDTISGHTEFLSVTDQGIDIENDLIADAERRLEDLELTLSETEWSDPNRAFGRDKTYASVAKEIEDCKLELANLNKEVA
tara:strand:+ start:524 stop:967 length:444 start_codon:yes stop_codon:yes gene_type:complete